MTEIETRAPGASALGFLERLTQRVGQFGLSRRMGSGEVRPEPAISAKAKAEAVPTTSGQGRIAPSLLEPLRPEVAAIAEDVGRCVLGRSREIRLALACHLAGGHLLLDGLPGMGKTTLATALGAALGLSLQRVQFTADLMPSDVLGVSIPDSETGAFHFHPGPIFAPMILADEINRAPPRAQSALLEAMEERRVTVDGTTHPLPAPFFVVATQNPVGQIGAFPLPESQLDRFLMRIRFDHLARPAEREVLAAGDLRMAAGGLAASLATETMDREAIAAIPVSDPVIAYVQDLLEASRDPARFAVGLSLRAGLGLLGAARAWAWMHDQSAVEPEDVQAVFGAVAAHRLEGLGGMTADALCRETAIR
ncbi:MAG: AAA family ATPase [Pseudomonadota bacterium]